MPSFFPDHKLQLFAVKGSKKGKDGKKEFFHLLGASASHTALHTERILEQYCATNIDNDPGVRRVSP
jgi:hypothetical protein